MNISYILKRYDVPKTVTSAYENIFVNYEKLLIKLRYLNCQQR